MAARNPPKNGRAWTPERVRERIRTGLLVSRLEKQALNELKDEEMTALQQDAAKYLVSLIVPRAEAAKNINVNLSLSDLIKQSMASNAS